MVWQPPTSHPRRAGAAPKTRYSTCTLGLITTVCISLNQFVFCVGVWLWSTSRRPRPRQFTDRQLVDARSGDVAVRQNLRKATLFRRSKRRTTPTPPTSVHAVRNTPCPLTTIRAVGCGHIQKRRPSSVVGNFEMVRKSAFFAIHASVAF